MKMLMVKSLELLRRRQHEKEELDELHHLSHEFHRKTF